MGTDANEVAVSSKSIEGKGGPEEEEEEEEEQEEEEELGCCPSWRCRFSSDEEGGSSLPESDSSTTAAGDAEEDAACLMFVSEERRGKERGGRRRRRGRWSRLRRKRHALAREFFPFLPWLFLALFIPLPFLLPHGMQNREVESVAWRRGRASRLQAGAWRSFFFFLVVL